MQPLDPLFSLRGSLPQPLLCVTPRAKFHPIFCSCMVPSGSAPSPATAGPDLSILTFYCAQRQRRQRCLQILGAAAAGAARGHHPNPTLHTSYFISSCRTEKCGRPRAAHAARRRRCPGPLLSPLARAPPDVPAGGAPQRKQKKSIPPHAAFEGGALCFVPLRLASLLYSFVSHGAPLAAGPMRYASIPLSPTHTCSFRFEVVFWLTPARSPAAALRHVPG